MITISENPPKSSWAALSQRAMVQQDAQVDQSVREIIDNVRIRGDEAVREYTLKFDGATVDELLVPEHQIDAAEESIDPKLKAAIDTAAANIRRFHEAQLPSQIDLQTMPGVRCVQRPIPLRCVGLYIPGGTAALFSTVLMLGIPASVAGCKRVVMCTPPDGDGSVNQAILYAAKLCGIREIFKVGGAQAIAAMAFSTPSIPRVDKIFGPGNRYVTAAKRILGASQVAIDMPAGPSEVMVLADDTARAEFVAADMLSQAEHGADSQAILVTTSPDMAQATVRCIEKQIATLPRREIALKALQSSRIIVLASPDDMIEFANGYAPEHLIISTSQPWAIAEKITTSGSVFIGNLTPESAGDYASGTNHTLPTSGWARALGGVGTESFMRRQTFQEISEEGLRELGEVITVMARAEGLEGHAQSVEVRLKTLDDGSMA